MFILIKSLFVSVQLFLRVIELLVHFFLLPFQGGVLVEHLVCLLKGCLLGFGLLFTQFDQLVVVHMFPLAVLLVGQGCQLAQQLLDFELYLICGFSLGTGAFKDAGVEVNVFSSVNHLNISMTIFRFYKLPHIFFSLKLFNLELVLLQRVQ